MPASTTNHKDQPMSTDDWAVICSIKQEPNYQFIRSEKRMAERLADLGLLERKDNKRYAVTAYGERCFAANQLLATKH